MPKQVMSNDEIIKVGSITVIIILIAAGIGAVFRFLTELKETNPLIFWLIIAGIIIVVLLLAFIGWLIYKKIKYNG
jgi:hypothetical protein